MTFAQPHREVILNEIAHLIAVEVWSRIFIQDNFTMWLSECHVDGFRWDTPNLMMHDNLGKLSPRCGQSH